MPHNSIITKITTIKIAFKHLRRFTFFVFFRSLCCRLHLHLFRFTDFFFFASRIWILVSSIPLRLLLTFKGAILVPFDFLLSSLVLLFARIEGAIFVASIWPREKKMSGMKIQSLFVITGPDGLHPVIPAGLTHRLRQRHI